MNIIFLSATCARTDYDAICQKRKYPLLDSSQKFFEMFLHGLQQQPQVTVDCITVRPLSHGTYPGLYIPPAHTTEGNLRYHYVPILNLPVIKTVCAALSVRRYLKRLLRQYRGQDTHILCDPLLLDGLLPAVALGKRYGVPVTGFLTDMPDYADAFDGHGGIKDRLYRLYNRLSNYGMERLDGHVVLTEAMACIAKEKPWMLLDCIVDETMLEGIQPLPNEDPRPRVLYAGKLHREFGLDLLEQAIPLVQRDCVFHIYGDGNHADALRELARREPRLQLHGIVPLPTVLAAELGADLLINPRTGAGEFTKYSFPSKTAEYMLAGVPVVMFHLPGIAKEYADYIPFAKEETPAAFAAAIDRMLDRPTEERQAMGQRAKDYIRANKNCKKQAARVVAFLNDYRKRG